MTQHKNGHPERSRGTCLLKYNCRRDACVPSVSAGESHVFVAEFLGDFISCIE